MNILLLLILTSSHFLSFFLFVVNLSPKTRADSSIIGIRSNYNVNDAIVNTNLSNLSPLTVSTSNSIVNNLSIAPATASDPQHVNQNQVVLDASRRDKSPQKSVETVNVHVVDSDVTNTTTTTTSTSDALPTITVTPTDDSDNSIDGMLDRISHDLDYLLNRVADIPPPPQPPTATIPIQLGVHEVIIEEEPEDIS